MFCTHCGKELSDGAVFCPNCGNRIRAAEPVRQAEPVQPRPVQPAYTQPAPAVRAVPPVQPVPASGTTVYTQTAKPKETAPSRKADTWPASCGVMGILALMFHLTAAGLMMAFGYRSSMFSPVLIITYILMIVVFFVHTRKIPWVTIFPFLIYIILMFYQRRYFIEDLSYYRGGSWIYLVQILTLALPVILFIFYVLLVLIRPESSGLRVVFLIFLILEFIALFVTMCNTIYQMIRVHDIEYMFYSLFAQLSTLFFFIGYGVAGMNVRK